MRVSMNRREFVASSASSVGLVIAGPMGNMVPKKGSVIQILMTGGPGSQETWDPKSEAPVEGRSPFKPIATRVPGIYISELFPRIADRMDKVSIIRTLSHQSPPLHEVGLQLLQTGDTSSEESTALPHFGAVVSAVDSAPSGVPSWVILGGPLGDTGVDLPQGQTSGNLMVSHHPNHLAALSPHEIPVSYGDTPFGASCYQAARLVEQGVRVVTINMFTEVFERCTWDMHACSKKLFVSPKDYRETLGPMFDRAFSALIDDLARSGQLSQSLVMAAGEVGRTPTFNRHGGRDHWSRCWSMLMAGGGIHGGTVVGESDHQAGEPVDRPVHPAEVVATAYRTLGIPGATMLPRSDGSIRPIINARPIAELI